MSFFSVFPTCHLVKIAKCLARCLTILYYWFFITSAVYPPLLKSLHWLPVQYRILFKMCTITYQALSSKQPSYLHTLLTPIRKPIQLRSSTSDLLFVPKINANMGTRAFAVGAPTLWNMFPSSVKSVENIAKFRFSQFFRPVTLLRSPNASLVV